MARVEEVTIRREFDKRGIQISRCAVRDIPGETNVLVHVSADDYDAALEAGDEIERALTSDFDVPTLIVIRRDTPKQNKDSKDAINVQSRRVDELLNLIAARNRVSEVQPSLSYVRDSAGNLALATAQRNHLILGRRGVGKSTLLVEAKQRLDESGAVTVWINFQTYRRQTPQHILLLTVREICQAIVARLERDRLTTRLLRDGAALTEKIDARLAQESVSHHEVNLLTPGVQTFLKHSLNALGTDLFVMVDDFYLIPRDLQPEVLDMLHGCMRDTRSWMKVATIKNLSRWFTADPPTGLQTGHDVDIIDLDISLQEPSIVSTYLGEILTAYCEHSGIPHLSRVIRAEAQDRLVLAAGGVPRDYLVLASRSIRQARNRSNAKVVGVQDVNQAAGEAADDKIAELEEDVAANKGAADKTMRARKAVRDFCLDEQRFTYFRVDFADKEEHPQEYQLFAELLDMRLVHLIHDSLSDGKEAGRKYEVFLLDLSHYSGSRLKQNLQVLDLSKGQLISKLTKSREPAITASTSREQVAMLRRAPLFSLDRLHP